MMWSKLQKQLYKIMDPTVNFQMHCSVFKTKSAWNAGQKAGISKKKESIPHYWITVNKEIIWDYPNMFLDKESQNDDFTIKDTYFFYNNYTWVSEVIRDYINVPREKIETYIDERDKYGLIDALRKYDRRISKNKRSNM